MNFALPPVQRKLFHLPQERMDVNSQKKDEVVISSKNGECRMEIEESKLVAKGVMDQHSMGQVS